MKLFCAMPFVKLDLEVKEEEIIVQWERNFKESEADDEETHLQKS